MPVTVHAPSPDLRDHIRRYVMVDHAAARADAHLPETGTLVAFVLRGTCELAGAGPAPAASVTGITETLRCHAHAAGNRVAVVAFTPAGAAALFRMPLEEFANRTVALAEAGLGRRDWAEETARLRAAPSDADRVRRLDGLFRSLLAGRRPDPLLAAATAWLHARPAGARIAALVRHVGLSQSALERSFRRGVGLTPKRFAALVRFREAARLAGTGLDFTTVAHAAGYADQAHFARDCQRVTGAAPSRFFAAN